MSTNRELAEQLEQWIPSCGAEVPIQLEDVLTKAAAALRETTLDPAINMLVEDPAGYCECGRPIPWTGLPR